MEQRQARVKSRVSACLCLVTLLAIASPSLAQLERGESGVRRDLIRLSSPQQHNAQRVEIDVEAMPFRQVLAELYRKMAVERGVVIIGDDTDQHLSIFYSGSAGGLDRVLDEMLDAVGWVRVRSLDGPDLIYPSRQRTPAIVPAPVDPTADPFAEPANGGPYGTP